MKSKEIPNFLKCCGNCKYIEQSRIYKTGLGCLKHDELFIGNTDLCDDWELDSFLRDKDRIIYRGE